MGCHCCVVGIRRGTRTRRTYPQADTAAFNDFNVDSVGTIEGGIVRRGTTIVLATGLLSVGMAVTASPAAADPGWIAVAKSPSHEALDWGGGPGSSQAQAEAEALQLCARLQPAGNCYVVASGPACVAVAWDISEPLNLAWGGVGPTPAAALHAAQAAAGPFANDPEVRCSYLRRG
ncbi:MULTISPECIES: DUF4189 domain-containing protein [Mycolicibacterium]|nr:DUF4189 domain-containing protein [Mycolicibacterium smegmatis MC2 155]TBM39862.1 DUF4189 domain-containing protein [Mycolicibacterium smegmatis]TBM44819.1 DUF4189 domain-containing protein [Mycolicibacterium smegmatis]TBM54638.1 DUF4189 domain-containing protein [Mycolicibacterium smegmatis]TBM62910.1 DUF4189 domain-containing protein [Mycolicibacterium smegmatis]